MADVEMKTIHAVLLNNVMQHGFVNGIKETLKTFGLNENGGIESWIVGLAIGILVLAYILPMAFNSFYQADVTAFCKTIANPDGSITIQRDSTVIALWYLVPVLIIIGIIVYFAMNRKR